MVVDGSKGWGSVYYNHRFCRIFIDNLKFYREKFGFKLIGYVFMPDHYHLLILPVKKVEIQKIRQSLKGHIAHQFLKIMKSEWKAEFLNRFRDGGKVTRNRDAKYHIFQSDDYDFNVHNLEKLNEKLTYIHNNPVKNGLVEYACDYEYSSARNYENEDDSLIVIDKIGF